MIAKRIRAAIFAVLLCAAFGGGEVVNYNDWYNRYVQELLQMARTPGGGTGFVNGPDNPQPGETAFYAESPEKKFSGADDPALRAEVAQQLFRQVSGSNKSLADYGIDPEQFLNYYQQQGQFETRNQASPGDALDRAMGVAIPAFIGYAAGGAMGGAEAGATAGEGASYASNGNAVYDAGAGASSVGAGSAPPGFQVAQAPGTTMTDVSPGLMNPNSGMVEDFATPEMQKAGQNVLNGLPTPAPVNAAATDPNAKDKPVPATGTAPATAPANGTTAPKPESSIADKFKTAAQVAAGAGAIKGLLTPRTGSATNQQAANQLQETEAQRQARVQAATDSVNKAFAGYDDPYYQSIADSYKNFQSPLYNEQVTEARRTLPMSVPNTQSSAYERRARQLETDVQRGQTDLDSQAIQQANNRRGEIDAQKSDLLNMATAGADASTVADAAGQRAQMYAAPPQFSPIADMFAKYSADAANYALAGNANPGGVVPSRPVTPLSFSRSPSSSQRIVA